MSVGNKYMGSLRLGGLAIIGKANKGKRATSPTFPPPKQLPPHPKSARKESNDE
jgi:hypothetical protein